MMLTYVAAAFLAVVILLAMIGWGDILHRILRLNDLRQWAVLGCTGFAFTTFAGGLLNLAGIISPLTVAAYLAIGFGATLLGRPDAGMPEGSLKRLSRAGLVIAIVAALLLSVRLLGSLVVLSPTATPVTFNVFDDFQGYFVYPEKMIRTGSMGFDPYSLRRTATHSLGGSAFLKSMVLTLGSEQNFYLLDAGLGSILTIGLILAWARRLGLTLAAALGVILIFLAIPPPIYNTNSQLLTTAFFLTLFYVFPQTADEPDRLSRAALTGLLLAGICALRTNLIPAVFVFAAANGLLAALRSGRKMRALLTAILPFAFCILFLLPWLLDAWRWTGQPLPFSLHSYNAAPDFIAGYQKSNGWHSLPATIAGLPRIPYFVLAVLTLLVLPRLPRRSMEKQLFISALTAAAIGSLAVLVGMGGFNALARYVFPFLTATILLAILLFRSVPHRTIAYTAAALALGVWV
ncbi:MAG: hypothetical protein M3N54_06205, partial [Acidobacteriota bacterium]|nr:hypothetical protein [Acidobacteriota bacterium]